MEEDCDAFTICIRISKNGGIILGPLCQASQNVCDNIYCLWGIICNTCQ